MTAEELEILKRGLEEEVRANEMEWLKHRQVIHPKKLYGTEVWRAIARCKRHGGSIVDACVALIRPSTSKPAAGLSDILQAG
jgi:hypothetical protein